MDYKMEVKRITFVLISDNTLTPLVNYYGDKARLRLTGSVL